MHFARRYQYAATAGAILLAASTIGALCHRQYVPACGFALGTLILSEAAHREHRHLRRIQLEADWTRRRALGETPEPLNPCCLLAQHSGGEAHDHKCTDTDHSLASFLDQVEADARRDRA
ncbi:hypothetical protein [Streptomyces sp. CRN 30]|uniref:hypothetical protein n=1 Tax=Streptomyces sp. CRN 30 TaxID=3075613 RepID=UPI002A808066|nr:hypothetical protein [Streptomyces sp. CRN 30]